MVPSKIIKVAGIRVRVYLGAHGCYFADPEEARQHRNGHDWAVALVKITGDLQAAIKVKMQGNYAHLPLHNKEFREFLEVPADPS